VLDISAIALAVRYVRPDAATALDSRGWTFRRRLLEGLDHAAEVTADGGHAVGFRASAPPPRWPSCSSSPHPSRRPGVRARLTAAGIDPDATGWPPV
jgi:hypothetical protein